MLLSEVLSLLPDCDYWRFCKHETKLNNRLCGLVVRVRVVPRRTVVGDIDRRFDNLSGSHHQSPSRDYSHQDDQTTQTTETPGFKPFTVLS